MDAAQAWLWPDSRGRYFGKPVSAKWRRGRASLAKHIIASIGDVRIREITPQHLYQLQHDCIASGLDPQSVNSITHAVFLGMMRDMEVAGRLPRSVYFGLLRTPKLRIDRRRKWRTFSIEQRNAAIDFFTRETRAGPLVATLFLSGCRIGEAAGLRESDIDWSSRTITFERSRDARVLTPCKQEGSQRTVAMSDPLLDALLPLRGSRTGTYLFSGFRTDVLNVGSFRCNVWYPGLERAGLPRINVHHARHTWATIALQAGISLAEVAAQLGDTLAVVQDVYAHVLPTANANTAIGHSPRPEPPMPTAPEVVAQRLRLVR